MLLRLAAITLIFLCTSVAWMILGGTIAWRTDENSGRLRGSVTSLWGAPHAQKAPFAETQMFSTPPDSSDIRATVDLEYRQKGLLWFSTYRVGFEGDYEFRNPDPKSESFRVVLPLPATQAVYDNLQFLVDGQPATGTTQKDRVFVTVNAPPGQVVKVRAAYRSQGMESWRYQFGSDVTAVRNFHLQLTTDFKDIDFPDNTLAPSEKRETPGGWQLDWRYQNLLSGYEVALAMPEKIQPGPLAAQISYFAPVSLLFFFFLLFVITTRREIDLHPMNYFFLAGAFFAFHLLLAYLVDHVNLYVAFAASAVVSVALVVSYLRIVVGPQFAVREAGLIQVVYLVLFSYAFFFRGFTGLAITIGSILTLFVVMQMTARIRWSEKFQRSFRTALPAGPS